MLSVAIACQLPNLLLAFIDRTELADPPTRWVSSQSGEEREDHAKVASRWGVPFDTRSRLEIMQDLRKSGVDAWPSVSPRFLVKRWWEHYWGPTPLSNPELVLSLNGREGIPIGGISHRVTVYCNENGEYVTYYSGEHGFSNPKGMWNRNIDIAVVGDSFVHGACVPLEAGFVSLIRQRYPGTINLGNDGIGPLLELGIVKEYLPALKPRLVLWSYFEGNDLHDMSKEKYTLAKHYLESSFTQWLINQQEDIDRAIMAHIELAVAARTLTAKFLAFSDVLRHPLRHLSTWERIIKLSYLSDAVKVALSRIDRRSEGLGPDIPYNPYMSEGDLELFRQVLTQAYETIRGWGGTMVFLYLPQYERYQPSVQKGQPDREKILEIVRSLNIPVIDIHAAFERLPDPLEVFPFRLPTHYNQQGYQLVADEIVRFLDRAEFPAAEVEGFASRL
ncbi:hypothetical protein DNFV4_03005 [Nitrospira tepida]|uniref:SGNH hydrolase-type esterase domain-containing protein n=1 Tax=Nitrospira tepida TaxID=2973512 RepID=A0AA86N0M6_9BACT|nr:hypothetical protein DNFV4_03005 [Nitrospira tepida]